jgi:hypothetical protein
MRRLLCLLVLPLAFAAPATSQDKTKSKNKDGAPHILYAVPLVAKPGEKQTIALRGKKLDGVKGVKVLGADGAKLKVLGAKGVPVPNNFPAERVGDSEVEIELELPKGAKPGAVKLVAASDKGESEPYTLLLRDALPAVAEKEDNGGFEAAQKVSIPCAVEGTIKGERDVDVFAFAGKKGDKVSIEVRAARFGSPLDGFLMLHDADRKLLASSDDAGGSADPALAVTLPADGTYFISLLDAHDLGGPNFGYRLLVQK